MGKKHPATVRRQGQPRISPEWRVGERDQRRNAARGEAEKANRPSVSSQAEEAVTPRTIVTKSLPLLQSLGMKFIEASGCVSCHNNALPAMAVAIARERGFKINEQAVQQENARIAELWGAKREQFLQQRPVLYNYPIQIIFQSPR